MKDEVKAKLAPASGGSARSLDACKIHRLHTSLHLSDRSDSGITADLVTRW